MQITKTNKKLIKYFIIKQGQKKKSFLELRVVLMNLQLAQ